MVNHCQTLICLLNGLLGGLRLFSGVRSENAALFERMMKIHSNPPILYYGFNFMTPIRMRFNTDTQTIETSPKLIINIDRESKLGEHST